MKKGTKPRLTRRLFCESVGKGVTSVFAIPQILAASPPIPNSNWTGAEEWFEKIKGTHRIVYDATSIHDGFSVIWSWVFLDSNNQTGSADEDLTAIVAFRHNAFALALTDEIWSSYRLGKFLKIPNRDNGVPLTSNPYLDPPEGFMPEQGMSIRKLMDRGVMFCVCERSLDIASGMIALNKKLDAAQVKQEWIGGLYPGVQLVPSGVWAINRAQERGCSYCFAG